MTEERPGAWIHGMTMETWYLMCNAECKAWKNDYKFGHQTPGDTCYANMITLTFNVNISNNSIFDKTISRYDSKVVP